MIVTVFYFQFNTAPPLTKITYSGQSAVQNDNISQSLESIPILSVLVVYLVVHFIVLHLLPDGQGRILILNQTFKLIRSLCCLFECSFLVLKFVNESKVLRILYSLLEGASDVIVDFFCFLLEASTQLSLVIPTDNKNIS